MRKRILVVDDEQDFTMMLKHTLESEGYYEVREENVATCALQAARDFDPDLIILDIMMPHLDGSEVAARAKADPVLRDVPIIFMTALVPSAEAPGGSCSRGGQTFLSKDVPVERLIECIEEKIAAYARFRARLTAAAG